MWIVDVISYLALLVLLLYMTRVRPLERVRMLIDGIEVPGVVLDCRTQLSSRVGLLNTPALSTGDGLLLRGGGRAIHTQGMHFPIDVVFLDDAHRVLGWEKSVAPGRIRFRGPSGTRSILELGQGTIERDLASMKLLANVEVERWAQQS